MLRVDLREDGPVVRLAPAGGHLGEDLWKSYLSATSGARYDRDRKCRVVTLDKVPGVLVRLRDAGFDAALSTELRAKLAGTTILQWQDYHGARDRLAAIDKDIHERSGDRLFPFQYTGAVWLTLRQGGAALFDDQGTGKEQPVSEPVLTASGWVPIGSLKVGDRVVGSNGKLIRVLGVFPQGKRDVYRVTMTDGATTRCGLEHLWKVENARDRREKNGGRVLTLKDLLAQGLKHDWVKNSGHKWHVPLVAPIAFPKASKRLPLDPYVVGALIANGHLSQSSAVHAGTEEQRRILKPRLKGLGVELRPRTGDEWSYGLSSSIPKHNLLVNKLRDLELTGTRSWNKFVPRDYLFASVSERRVLLAALLDNDGTVDPRNGNVEYNTVSPQLAVDVIHLVRSLGGSAWMSTRIPSFTYKGERKKGRKDYRVRVALTFNPFLVPSKRAKFIPRTKYLPAHAIASVAPEGREESVCIRVDAPDSLYVTNDFILTHNTLQTLVSLPPNAPVLVICPASVKSVWHGHAAKYRPNLRVKVLEGRASFRWPASGEMLVANYELLPEVHDTEGTKGRKCEGYLDPEPCLGCKDELVTFPEVKLVRGHKSSCNGLLEPFPCPGCHPCLDAILPGTVVVIDEAQFVKSSKAERTVRVRAIGKASREKEGKCLVLSGTPLENDPAELWSVLQAAGLAQEAFGDWGTFVDLFKGRKTEHNGRSYGYSWDESPDDEVVERLRRVSLRRTKADVLSEIPSKVYSERIVPIDNKALEQCSFFLREHGGVEGIAKLLETEVRFETMSAILMALSMAKVSALLKIVADEYESRDEPVLVFAMHRSPVELLGKKKGWETILGGTADRGDIVERFQAGKLRGLACTIKAAGTGLTLTKTDTAIFLSRSFNPMVNIQAEDRIHRIGQTRIANIVSLVGDHPLDRRIAEITAKKIRLFNASVGASSVVTNDKIEAGQTKADRDFEAYLKRIEDEVKGRPLPRQFARTAAEAETLAALEEGRFARRSDDRLACELSEEARAIGLSEPRWRLALVLAERAEPNEAQDLAEADDSRAGGPASVASVTSSVRSDAPASSLPAPAPISADRQIGGSADQQSNGKDGLVMIDGDPHLAECAAVEPHRACTCGSVPEEQAARRTEFERDEPNHDDADEDDDDDEEEPMNEQTKRQIETVVALVIKMKPRHQNEIVMQLIDAMTIDDRAILFEDVIDDYHVLCGQPWPEKDDEEHDCPAEDDDEDDDDGDDLPTKAKVQDRPS